jgi:hypothetical protein
MRTRKEMMASCPEEFEDEMKDILDEIETGVNSAHRLLEDIGGVGDLDNVDQCMDELNSMANKLY